MFDGLTNFFRDECTSAETAEIFTQTVPLARNPALHPAHGALTAFDSPLIGVHPLQLPAMARMALRMPDLFLRPIPLLRIGQAKSITLNQEQVRRSRSGIAVALGFRGQRSGVDPSPIFSYLTPVLQPFHPSITRTRGVDVTRLRACWRTPSFAPTRAETRLRAQASTPAFRASTLTGTSSLKRSLMTRSLGRDVHSSQSLAVQNARCACTSTQLVHVSAWPTLGSHASKAALPLPLL